MFFEGDHDEERLLRLGQKRSNPKGSWGLSGVAKATSVGLGGGVGNLDGVGRKNQEKESKGPLSRIGCGGWEETVQEQEKLTGGCLGRVGNQVIGDSGGWAEN